MGNNQCFRDAILRTILEIRLYESGQMEPLRQTLGPGTDQTGAGKISARNIKHQTARVCPWPQRGLGPLNFETSARRFCF